MQAASRARADKVDSLSHLDQLVRANVGAVREAEIQQRELALQVCVAEWLPVLVNQLPGAADGRLAHRFGRRTRQKL